MATPGSGEQRQTALVDQMTNTQFSMMTKDLNKHLGG